MNYLMNNSGELFEFSAHKAPEFKELKSKDWIMWGYDSQDREWNNLQPSYYEWLYNSSSKHRAIINRKCLFINGKGLEPEDRGLNLGEKIELRQFVHKYNDSGFIKKVALNLTKLGGLSYEVIADKKGEDIYCYYINFGFLRRSKKEYDDQGRLKPAVWYYTSDWSSRRPEENPDFVEFHEWDWESPMDKNKRYIVVDFDDEINPYPVPEYTAAVPYIAADYEISNFVYNNTKNGFSAGWLVNFFNGEPSDEEKSKIAKYWKSRLHGSDNSGEPVLSFNDIGVEGVDITPLNPNGQDDRFINLNKQIREEIFAGHTINPIVAGLEGNNGFNNNADEERSATENFQAFYVKGKQMLIEQHLNAIRAHNNIKGSVKIQRLDPIRAQLSSADVISISTTDEAREMAGLPKSTTESNEVADALGTISPLVATKVLETMTSSEVRAIVGLDTPKGGVVVREDETTIEMSKDNQMIYELSKCGIWSDELEVVGERECFATSVEEAETEYNFLNAGELAILGLLLNNRGLTVGRISELLERPVSEVQPLYDNLKNDGLIDDEGNITREGREEAEQDEVFVVYKYDLRIGVSGPDIKDTTRDFCANLIRLSRIKRWTLEDIKRMNNGQGLDVFRSGGGYWNDNGNIKPHCRHAFKMQLVRRKK
jgi:hypothetical protein